MKTNPILSQPMRTITLLLLFVTGFAYADPIINPPTPYTVCDSINNDGFASFDLHLKDTEIINGQPNLVIGYFETLTDAQVGANEIFGTNYYNITPNIQTVYVRATDTNDSSFATTTLDLIINPAPIANTVANLTQVDIPYDGQAEFDLISTSLEILGGQTGMMISYHPTLVDAEVNTNPFVAPSSYINVTNPQTIYARVENMATGCSSISSFQLIVTNPDIVYIPDPNFKWELVHGSIATDAASSPILLDANSDGEIQVTEALLAHRLDPINTATTTFEGIKSFLNLEVFYTPPGCNIDTFDVSGLQNLRDLQCQYNQIHTLNVSDCPALQRLFCGNNFINTLDLTGKPNLNNVWCEQNQISSLDVTGSPLLLYLSCRNNNLSALDLTNNIALTDLNCGANLMTSIDVSNCTNLASFHCAALPITSLDLTNNDNIVDLNVRYTNLTAIDVSNLAGLSSINCDGNLFTELDLSHNPVLCGVQCSNSNSLNYLNIKNGGLCNSAYMITANPNLQFVCADEEEADYYRSYFDGQGMTTVVNSYCSFVPGGNFNTITGVITFDNDNDGCEASDPTQPNIKVKIATPIDLGYTFSNATGNYTFYTNEGAFAWMLDIENPSWFTFTPALPSTIFPDNNNNIVTQNFCLAPNGNHKDVEMVIMPLTPARPGFDTVYKLVYKNKGNQTADVFLNFSYDDVVLDFVSSSVLPSGSSSGHLSWTVFGLQPFQSGSVEITFHLNSPTDTPPVNIGDILTFTSFIDITTDENWTDNAFTLNQTVVGAFDPNAITCLEGDSLPATEIGKYLHYGVTFENTGNYAAENVVVKDVIDTTKYDINSLQVLGTSHPSYIKITENIVEFVFQNIDLAPSSGTPPVGGHGDVLFKIKSKTSLVNGDYVSKSAKIYFDYNAPITTNDALTTFATLNNPIHDFDNSVKVYPNPAHTIINISCSSTIQTVALYDIQGRLLETNLTSSNEVSFDISGKSNGVYFIKITSDKGSKVEKIVKE
ncbi:MAG: T9SS type A sorting domain-containing protein [Bacteroidota bacterium]